MFNKRFLPDEALEDALEEKRLRHNLLDVFSGNNLSAQRSALVFENARTGEEAANIDDLAVNRKHGNQTCDLLRSFPEHEMASRLCLYYSESVFGDGGIGSLDSYRAKQKLQPPGLKIFSISLLVEFGPYVLALQLYEELLWAALDFSEHGFLRAAATTGQVHLQAFLHSRIWHRQLQGRLSTCCGSRDNERLHGIIPVLPFSVSERIRGQSMLQRCAKLYADTHSFYERNGTQDRLPKLLPTC
eukprot:s5457_g5.t1